MDCVRTIVFITLNFIAICSATKCPSRCLTCRSRDFCTTCKPTYWDVGQYRVCHRDCPITCVSGECDDETGHCKECPRGFYGDMCQYKCDTCAKGLCGLKKCTFGCKDGFYGEENKSGIIECKKCYQPGCSKCSGENTCAQCESGYHKFELLQVCLKCPKYCKKCRNNWNCTECVAGRYGDKCEHECNIPHCSRCTPSTGQCIACNPGFELANGTCICSKSCKSNCDENGTCLGKCHDGYSGAFCELTCSRNCKTCYRYNVSYCTQCPYGFYGDQCNARCSHYCFRRDNTTQICSRVDGKCSHGCVTGRYGARCGQVCPKTCINSSCHHGTGACVHGCVEGFTGPRCLTRISTTIHTGRITRRPPFFDERYTTSTSMSATTSASAASNTIFPRPRWPDAKRPTNKNQGQIDTNKSMQSRDADHKWYLYLCLGIGLCVAVFIVIALAGYFLKRRHNTTQKQQHNATPNVIYTPDYNYIDCGDCSRPKEEQDVIYAEPQTESAYEHIGDEEHEPHTTAHSTYDSYGYLEPATKSNQGMNAVQDYLTPIHSTVHSSDEQSSAYEPLRQRDITNTTYSALQSNSLYHNAH